MITEKEFWEWCGFKYDHWGDDLFIIYPDGRQPQPEPPAITLDNLFKYAIPKLLNKYWLELQVDSVKTDVFVECKTTLDTFVHEVSTDLTQALYKAICELIEQES